ncbi:MAG: fucose isomerase [Anaerolinea sp.]|nr:fucose isomerase [Anaerolinea sp.]
MSKLGFVSILRTTFDVPLAQEMIRQARSALTDAGYELLGRAEPIATLDEARAAADELAALAPDLVVVFQSTFADSTMVMALAHVIDAPLLLWAVPEEHTGGRLRLNSLCGINLAGHALTRARYRYGYLYTAPSDPAALTKIAVYARAAAARRELRHARIGRVGENPAGFDTCLMDVADLKNRFGVEIVQIDLQEQVFAEARAAAPDLVSGAGERLAGRVTGLDTLDQTGVSGTLGVYVALQEMARREKLSGYSVRCWPEFFTELGCAACGAMSMLNDEQTPSSCEADVNGTITSLMLQALSGDAAFGSDVVSLDAERDALVLWHCGLAPLSMADADEQPGVTIHSNRKLPLLMEFTLKPGMVTIARLSEATGEYRLVIGRGEMIRAPRAFSGTSGHVRFEHGSREALDTILREGLEHHISITYGDYVEELLVLAQMLNLPVLQL